MQRSARSGIGIVMLTWALSTSLVSLAACDTAPDTSGKITGCPPTPTATATSAPAGPITDATLGGTQQTFDAKYVVDSIIDQNDTNHIYDVSCSGYSLWIGVSQEAGTDGKQHISGVGVSPHPTTTPDTWKYAVGKSFITPFLPADAVYQHDVTTEGGTVEHIYISHNLALTFPAAAFTAEDRITGYLITPGTFEWDCYRTIESDPGHTSQCGMKLGAALGSPF